MARPVKIRRLITPHKEIIFTPERNDKSVIEKVTLLSEEYEVIKLVDYENMHQLQASKIMGISRPTLTRIYEKARNKIAECLVELKELRVEGGNSILGDNWFKCNNCESILNIPEDNDFKKICPLCLSHLIKKI
jgi:predicted DNA-binding protein (UPF0251 family)